MADWLLSTLADMFASTVTIEPFVSQDGFGNKTYGAAVTRNCHIEGKSRLVQDIAGQERVSTVQVYLNGAYSTTVDDRVTLPAPWSPTQPPIIAVGRQYDEAGFHHEVLYM